MALLTATPARRRAVMIALLLLAVAGAVIRKLAPNPSTLRDVGTLLLVMWLPAVGNLIAYLIRKIPRRAPPAAIDFPAQAPFTPHLQVELQPLAAPGEAADPLDAAERRCTVLVGQHGFSARLEQPLASALAPAAAAAADAGAQAVSLEFLRPDVALPQLTPGTDFHLLAGRTAVATGRVIEAPLAVRAARPAQ